MDCKTARLLLDLSRAGRAELAPDEAEALEEHLAACPDCDALARAERAADDHLGHAVRAVEVPAGLRDRLLARLAAERRQAVRRRIRKVVRGAAAAAVLLLLSWGGYHVVAGRLQKVDLYAFWDEIRFFRPDEDEVRRTFRRLGHDAAPPADFNYAYLVAYGVTIFQNQEVPQLVFVRTSGAGRAYAQVYVLSARRFDLSELPGDFRPEEGYATKVDVLVPEGRRQAYLVVYTGDDLNWLWRDPSDGSAT